MIPHFGEIIAFETKLSLLIRQVKEERQNGNVQIVKASINQSTQFHYMYSRQKEISNNQLGKETFPL